MDVVFIHIILGVLLFFIINWIGKHSYSIGYMEISIFVKTEEAPALNFLIRVLTPIVYIILISTILYNLKLDKYVVNIFFVNVYYILFRLAFNLITNRGILLNWYRQFLYWFSIIVLSYYTYDKLIKIKANILPDFTTVSNELWIIILIFLFQIANNLRFSQDETQKRKENYLVKRHSYFKEKYGILIEKHTKNEILECIVYAILIYEDFNRPKVARIIENINFKITKKPHTLGVMQVFSKKLINDYESVKLGTKKIVRAYKKFQKINLDDDVFYFEHYAINYIIKNYNGGNSYTNEVSQLFEIIKDKFYENSTDKLTPKK